MAQLVEAENQSENRLVCEVQLKSSAEKVYDIYRNKCNLLQEITPPVFLKVELLRGEWNRVGSERLWTYVDGKFGSWKDTVEAIDDEKKSVTWTLLDGAVPKKLFESMKVEYQFTAKGEGCKAEAFLTFKKKSDGVPNPVDYINAIRAALVAVDVYLCKP